MLDSQTINNTATRLEAAVTGGDRTALEELLSADFALWYAARNFEVDRSQAIEIILNLSSELDDFRYEDAVRYPTETGYVQRHFATSLHEGERIRVPACVFMELKNGQICYAREYFDSASDPRR